MAKRVYMHTIDGKPAHFSAASGQLVFPNKKTVRVHTSLVPLREEQRATKLFRRRKGLDIGAARLPTYGYLTLVIEV